MLDALLEPRYVVAQRVDVAAKFLHIGRPCEERLLLGPVLDEVFGKTQYGFALPRQIGRASCRERV